MEIKPIETYEPPYPGKPEQRKKAALRAAALLSASLLAVSGVQCGPRMEGEVTIDEGLTLNKTEPAEQGKNITLIDKDGETTTMPMPETGWMGMVITVDSGPFAGKP